MPRENASARRVRDARAFRLRHIADDAQHLVPVRGNQYLAAGFKDGREPWPPIADHRNPACRRLEQSYAWRIAQANHVGAGDIQCKTLLPVKPRMPIRADMFDAIEIDGPLQVYRGKRAGHCESAFGPSPRRLPQQGIERALTVGAIGAEITQLAAHTVGWTGE